MGDIFVQSLIDVELWDSARWKGTAFLHDPRGTEPPGLGLLFDDMRSGKRIFSGWQERVGKADRYEEIRVSVIRGEILGLASGYSVHISSDPLHSASRADAEGSHLDFQTAVIISRVQRMTPTSESVHLAQFEKDFLKHKRYLLLPVSLKGNPEIDFAIEKHEIHFRQASEINADDVDAAIFPEHYFDNDTRIH